MSESLEQMALRISRDMKASGKCYAYDEWDKEYARRLRAEWDKEQELTASRYVCPHCNAEQQKQEPVSESDIIHAADMLIEDLAHVEAGSSLERGIILGAFSIFAKLYAAPVAAKQEPVASESDIDRACANATERMNIIKAKHPAPPAQDAQKWR